MYNRPVSKCHPRVEACGSVDELNSALGLARALAPLDAVAQSVLVVQADLVAIMGELATSLEDLPLYLKDGYARITPALTARLDRWVQEIQSQQLPNKGWATPGANPTAAAFDLARSVCRRAERRVCALREAGQLQNPEILVYLNRLSDLLWLWARRMEGANATPERSLPPT